MIDVSAISFGPCWCDGDFTTGGHWHGSATGGNAERRITSDTGGTKNQKTARFDLIPSAFLWQLAEVYGHGSTKYADENWRLGYDWKLTFGAAQRHLHLFWMGENTDAESGLHHLVHAAWHMATLFTFSTEEERYGRFDDRPTN